LRRLVLRFGATCGDVADDRDIDDRIAPEMRGESHSAGLAGRPNDHAFALKRTQVIHRCRLAGEAEVFLDFPG
jgi:hypothetical protein